MVGHENRHETSIKGIVESVSVLPIGMACVGVSYGPAT